MKYENVLFHAFTNAFAITSGNATGGGNLTQSSLSNIKIISAICSYRALDSITGLAYNDVSVLINISGGTSKNSSSKIPGFSNYTPNIIMTCQGYENLKLDLNINASPGDSLIFSNIVYLLTTKTNNVNIQVYWLLGYILLD